MVLMNWRRLEFPVPSAELIIELFPVRERVELNKMLSRQILALGGLGSEES